MIGFIDKWLVTRNPALTMAHARRLVQIGLVLALVVLIVGGIALWDHLDDNAAIRKHDAGRVEDTLAAERSANEGGFSRAAAREATSRQTIDELEDIHAEDPEGAAAPASRGSRAVAERLRSR